MKQFDFVGTWWFYPSFLESPPGPWDKSGIYGDDPARNWKAAIDWMARRGLNVLVSGIPPFCKDRVYHDWGYHYVLEFRRFPEARVFTDEFIERNQSILREIFGHARRRGIKPFIHHYNFCAPVPFVKAHEEMASKMAGYTDGRKNLQDWLGYLYGNVCWNEPVYQEFMKSCFSEFLEAFPDVEGIMITPGECARCPCEKCKDRLGTLSSFVNTFVETVRLADRLPLVRAWATGLDAPWIEAFPKGVPYVIKYSVFDCIDAPPDPAIKAWVDGGHRVWISKEIKGGENAGPIAWFDPGFFRDVAANSRKLGAEGLISIDNSDAGFMGMRYRVQQLLLEMFVRYATESGRASDKEWITELEPYFGAQTAKVFRAVKLYSSVVLNVSKLAYGPTEGFTWKSAHNFAGGGRFPGTFGLKGSGGLEPPEWVRGDIGSIADAVEYLSENPWRDDVLAYVSKRGTDPVEFASGLEAKAERGLRLLEGISDADIPRKGLKELALLRTSARLAVHTISSLKQLLWGRVLYAGAKGPSSGEVRSALAEQMVVTLRDAHLHLRKQLECVLDLPHCTVDFARLMASQRYWEPSLSNRIRKLEREFVELVEELSEVLPEKPSMEPSLIHARRDSSLW